VDFSQFKVDTGTETQVQSKEKGYKFLNEYYLYRKVYQHCRKCETERIHAILGILIKCCYCGHEYKSLTREELDKRYAEEKIKPEQISSGILNVVRATK
jgi:hypothetical protein